MKQAVLVHGTGGSGNDYYWFDYIKKHLEDAGYEVSWPALPNTQNPELIETEDAILDVLKFDKGTIIIAHSSGCPVTLHLLQHLKIKIDKVVLVSGYYDVIDGNKSASRMLPEGSFDWNTIRQNTSEMIMINSDNDPWKCDDLQAREPAIKLGAKLIVNSGEGHMGSSKFNQPYREFELLKRILG